MSRLDAEYDPAEHHNLDRIEPTRPTEPNGQQVAICCCGDDSGSWPTVRRARRWHDEHRDDQLGLR